MLSTPCPTCTNPKNPNARQCRECSKETIRQALLGHTHSEERRRANSEGQKRRTDNRRFDLAALTRGKPSWRAKPLGSTYTNKDGRVWVKINEHGKTWSAMWKRRAHVVWERAHGPVPRGRLLHHRNEDRGDDRLANLQLVTRAEHARVHADPERMRAAQLLGVAARKRKGTY